MWIHRNEEKNIKIKQQNGRYWFGFEEVEKAIQDGRILDVLIHDDQKKYPWQKILIIEIQGYAWRVPYIESEQGIFLKTMYPSRKATLLYLIDQE